jgi:hypothetical protein
MNADPVPLPSAPVPDFKDRRTGLIVFGILEIVLGALVALMVVFLVLGRALAATGGREQMPFGQMIPTVVMYIVASAVLIALGIGSCQTRRWARALTLVVAWSWLVVGGASTVVMGFYLPKILNASQAQGQTLPEGTLVPIVSIAIFFMSIFLVVVPGTLVFFYQSRHVKATCEARDPAPGWTDACPLRVLGVSVWLGFGAVIFLTMPLSTNGVFPVFGRILSGVSGILCCVILASVWAYSAWAIYRLRAHGWWIVVISLCVVTASTWITFTRIDLAEMYRLMGYSQQQVDLMKQYSFGHGGTVYLSVAGAVPMLGFLLFVKRDFRRVAQSDPVMAHPQ